MLIELFKDCVSNDNKTYLSEKGVETLEMASSRRFHLSNNLHLKDFGEILTE